MPSSLYEVDPSSKTLQLKEALGNRPCLFHYRFFRQNPDTALQLLTKPVIDTSLEEYIPVVIIPQKTTAGREDEILADLLPRALTTLVFAGLLENGASEQGARMSAMDNATRNVGDMINKLSITYNPQRQAQITKELIEIISGAEAL